MRTGWYKRLVIPEGELLLPTLFVVNMSRIVRLMRGSGIGYIGEPRVHQWVSGLVPYSSVTIEMTMEDRVQGHRRWLGCRLCGL